jgi:hypothetical protein
MLEIISASLIMFFFGAVYGYSLAKRDPELFLNEKQLDLFVD